MKLVQEDKYGAYLGVHAGFLKKFAAKEINPNFEVYDSDDNQNRFIVVKCSRLPDDEDLATGRYGIDFHRAKPEHKEAIQYKNGLPDTLETTRWLRDISFAAATAEEYKTKSPVWEQFYSHIWGTKPQTIWVTPHSGNVDRPPDNILPFPKLEMDAFTAGVAALCAFNSRNTVQKRVMISIHSHNWYEAILELGGFDIIDEQRLSDVAKKIGRKYHERVQILADECKQDFYLRAMKWLEHINKINGTLHPDELNKKSLIDKSVVNNITNGLKIYGAGIDEYTLEEFKKAIQSLNKIEIQVISYNKLFPGKHVGKLLKLSENISHGQMDSALQIECMKFYLKKDPELITNIILDIKNELFY
jgi:hypothetical protein